MKIFNKSGIEIAESNPPGTMFFEEVKLLDAQLSGMQMEGINFGGAELRECDFSGSDLYWANFYGANSIDCNFTGADLRGATLREAKFALRR